MAGIRSAMRSPMRSPMARAMGDVYVSLAQQALAILRKFGSNAHVYLPGAGGVAVSGLQTGNYTLSDGSSGYSAIDGTAGLVLDAAGAVGAELVTNGDFSAGTTGWTTIQSGWTVSGGAASVNSSAAGSTYIRQGTTVAGKTYQVTFTVTSYTSGNIFPTVGGNIPATGCNAAGTYTVLLVAADTSGFGAYASSTNTVATVDNISVKEVTGIHASQATAGNRPAERRGLYNLLTYSNDLSNAVWVAQLTASKSGSNLLVPAMGDRGFNNTLSLPAGKCTILFLLSGSGTCDIWGYNATDGNIGITQVTLSATPTLYAVTITPTVAGTNPYFGRNATQGNATATSITFGGAAYVQGQITAAQAIAEGGIPLTTTTAASNSAAGRYWWQFDGSNDSLALGSVPFQMSDDHCVIAGLQLGANATTRYALNPAVGAGSQRVGSIYINGTNTIGAGWTDDVAAANITSPSTYTGQTVVASAVKQTNAKRLRVNGAQSGATDNTVMGTTTLTAGGAIGDWKSGGGNNWIGSIGPVILIKGTVSDADLLTLERWVASATPNGPVF